MPDASPDGVEGRVAWTVAFASLVLIAIGLGGPMLLAVSLKQIAAEFGWPRSVPSLAYSLALLGEGAGAIAIGWWSDRRGVALPILVSSLALGSGVIVASAATSKIQLFLAYGALVGLLGTAALFSPLIANTTRWFTRRRGLAVALVACGQSLAGAVWPPTFRFVSEHFGWRTAFLGFGLFALATMMPLALVARRRAPAAIAPAAPPRSRGTGGRALGLPAPAVHLMLFLAMLCCCAAMAMPLVHIVSHVSDLGYPLARGAEVLSVMLAASMASRFAFGWLSDRIGGLRTLLLGSSLQAASLALFAGIDELAAIYAVALLFAAGFGGIVPSYAIIVREHFPERGTAWRITTIFTGGALGMAVGSWLSGHIFDMAGVYRLAFVAGLGFNVANLAIVLALLWRKRRSSARLPLAEAAA